MVYIDTKKWRLCWFFLIVHSVMVVTAAIFIESHKNDAGTENLQQLWGIFLLFDFPTSLGIIHLGYLFEKIFADFAFIHTDLYIDTIGPAIFFGLFGGLHSFCLGFFLDKLIRRKDT